MKIRRIDAVDAAAAALPEQHEHVALGIPPLEEQVIHPPAHPWRRELLLLLAVPTLIALIVLGLPALLPDDATGMVARIADGLQSQLFLSAMLVGFGAQMIDGALGMAYGITATTFLLSSGVPPAAATASVHLSEVFTTGFSGFSHWRFGNVDARLFRRLVIPGVIGVVVGAYVITSIDGKVIKPYVSAYLLLMGFYILYKAVHHVHKQYKKELPRSLGGLALFGGFVDSVGGGGWGPVVTTSLVGSGRDPVKTIGSVNAAEFFLALSGAFTFALLGAFTHWQVIAGLVVGGLFAAPFAALLTRVMSARALMLIVGLLITVLSTFNLWKVFA